MMHVWGTPHRGTPAGAGVGAVRQPYPTLAFLLFLPVLSGNNGHMSDHIYKKIELVGSSPNGFEQAVHNALARAEKTVRNMRWFEVTETRGYIEDGKVGHWQVTLKIGFTLEG
jgi:hypothetical protein